MLKQVTYILNILFLSCFTLWTVQAQDPVPASPQTEPILLIGGTAHIGNGKVIENSAIIIEAGKIKNIANAQIIKLGDFKGKTIRCEGKHIYPGFIALNTNIGLTEVNAVRASRDFDELGAINPNVRALIAYNAESKIIPTVRSNGVLIAQSTPRGGLISGTSSLMMLDGWNWEDAMYKADDGVHMNWPQSYIRRGWWGSSRGMEINKKKKKDIQKLADIFEAAAANAEGSRSPNLRLASMAGLFTGRQRLYIHTNQVNEIIESIRFAQSYGVKKIVLVGGRDAWMAADFLKEHDIPVILAKIHSLPSRSDDDIDLSFRLPYLLQEAGILYCLSYSGGATGSRNLPFLAGTAAAYGLTKEQAVAAVSANAAKILGIDQTTGTLEPGKDATLFVSSGDALDMRSNQVEHAFINGKAIRLSSHHTMLYEKYKGKYERGE